MERIGIYIFTMLRTRKSVRPILGDRLTGRPNLSMTMFGCFTRSDSSSSPLERRHGSVQHDLLGKYEGEIAGKARGVKAMENIGRPWMRR